jgi:hypothetical protein
MTVIATYQAFILVRGASTLSGSGPYRARRVTGHHSEHSRWMDPRGLIHGA